MTRSTANPWPTDPWDEARRLRLWRLTQYSRLFFAIGLILLMSNWLMVLPNLWWSTIPSNAAASLTTWYILAQFLALRWLWRWLAPLMRGKRERERV